MNQNWLFKLDVRTLESLLDCARFSELKHALSGLPECQKERIAEHLNYATRLFRRYLVKGVRPDIDRKRLQLAGLRLRHLYNKIRNGSLPLQIEDRRWSSRMLKMRSRKTR